MIIGILETGLPPRRLIPEYGDYVDMFEALLGSGFDYARFDVAAGELPDPARPHDGYLVTGSAAGAYEDLPWIEPASAFLRAVKGRAKLIGVCFGHQLMAQAFGGKVVKSPKGWGIGLHTYRMSEREAWMDSAAPIAVAVSHQDQVVELAPGSRAIGGSDFCPNGVVVWDDQSAISMQCHPEFSPPYAQALLETRWAEQTLGDEAKAAIASLEAPNDRARVGGWMRAFLDG